MPVQYRSDNLAERTLGPESTIAVRMCKCANVKALAGPERGLSARQCASGLCGCLCDDRVRMQPHGISARIATAISESATFVNVTAFLYPCTVYSEQVTH